MLFKKNENKKSVPYRGTLLLISEKQENYFPASF